ncbi:MAG: type 4a pilus biogenesis protein PilO [bacterium]
MDLKDPKTQKILLGVMALFIVGYFWYTRLYVKYDSQIANKSQEFESITTNLRNVEMKAKSLDALKLEYSDLIDRYHEIEALLPEVKQIPSLLVQLHTASSITGTRITKLNPRPIESQQFYNIASFEIEMTGTYHDFGKFVSYVANFPFIANLTNMELVSQKLAISENDSQDDDSNHETLTAKFVLLTYFVKEDERLSELAL